MSTLPIKGPKRFGFSDVHAVSLASSEAPPPPIVSCPGNSPTSPVFPLVPQTGAALGTIPEPARLAVDAASSTESNGTPSFFFFSPCGAEIAIAGQDEKEQWEKLRWLEKAKKVALDGFGYENGI